MTLKEWLEANGEGAIPRLARAIKVSRQSIYNYLAGSKPTIQKAYEIEKTTNGKVGLYSWLEDKDIEKKLDSLDDLL